MMLGGKLRRMAVALADTCRPWPAVFGGATVWLARETWTYYSHAESLSLIEIAVSRHRIYREEWRRTGSAIAEALAAKG